MKNIQIIDSADNCVYDIFSVTDAQFDLIFAKDTDIAFIEDVYKRENHDALDRAFADIWQRRLCKEDVNGIHGTLFYGLQNKKQFYPDLMDNGARNPDGTLIRRIEK